MGQVQIEFRCAGVVCRAESGQTLLEVAEANGVDIEAACGGFAGCNTCRVDVIVGQFSELDPAEEPFLDRVSHRLACQARVVGDAVVARDPGA